VNGDQHPSASPQSIVHPHLFYSLLGAAISLFLLSVNPLPGQSSFATGSDRISGSKQSQGKSAVPGSSGSLHEKKIKLLAYS
jgi:hypothetical protein